MFGLKNSKMIIFNYFINFIKTGTFTGWLFDIESADQIGKIKFKINTAGKIKRIPIIWPSIGIKFIPIEIINNSSSKFKYAFEIATEFSLNLSFNNKKTNKNGIKQKKIVKIREIIIIVLSFSSLNKGIIVSINKPLSSINTLIIKNYV